jgi:CheY-like chemotaxis protein
MKSLALRAHKQGLELACHIAPDVPGFVAGDSSRVRQIVVNLVGNAIKFTEQGEVVLDVAIESREESHVMLHFAVRDTGIGIPEEQQTAIFDPFEQVDSTLTRRHGGSGLGLAISSRLVEQMGGRIWVDSRLGQGSTFHFAARFELAEGEPRPVRRADPASLQGLRVLAVDDNATNRRILEEILASWGMLPTTASGAREALQRMREARNARTPFSLILSDTHMPEMDGFTLAEQIAQDAEISSAIVMMLTSGDRPEDVARCEQSRIAAYLLKPVKQSELFDAITLALGIAAGEEKPMTASMDHGPRFLGPLQILLAEDSLVNQKLAVALLERHGHTVVVVNNGREALAALESRAFDLVLMDVQMPEMDGLEATALTRAREKHSGAHVPIVAMTAHALKGDRQRCLAAGMDDYISKPIHAKELFQTLEKLLAAPESLPPKARQPSTETMPLDWERALEAVEGDQGLLRLVAKTALEEIPRLMAAIGEAVAQCNAAALRLAAHTLQGAIRYFGPTPVFEQVCLLERIGQEGRMDDAPATWTILEEEIGRLSVALIHYLSEAETRSGL